jgi:cell division protein FtsQ
LLALAAGGVPWWGRAALAQLAFFRVRKVEIEGVRYLEPADVLTRLRVDTATSVWTDLAPLERRVAEDPQVGGVAVRRKLPGTLVVSVRENLPVALAPGRGGLRVLDSAGRVLPIDPSRVRVDVPVVAGADAGVLRLLTEVRATYPALFARISEVRRVGARELVVVTDRWPVRTMDDVTARRLAEIYPVEGDLARRRARVAELDLRYRDQVIARLQ